MLKDNEADMLDHKRVSVKTIRHSLKVNVSKIMNVLSFTLHHLHPCKCVKCKVTVRYAMGKEER